MAFLLLALATSPCAQLTPEDVYPGRVPVTCKLVYYAQFEPKGTNANEIRLVAPTPGRTNVDESSVQGVVMEVVTPKNLSGQIICIWLDPPSVFSGGVRFKPGVVYAGKWRAELIGKLAFKGEVAFVPVAEPLRGADGSQPSGSVTNRTSAAAGSRGSR